MFSLPNPLAFILAIGLDMLTHLGPVSPWNQGQRQDRMELESRGAVSDVSESKEKKFESEDLGQTIQGSVQGCVEWSPRDTQLGDGQSSNGMWTF